MSLFRDTLRPPAILSDEAVERYLAAIRAELEPDPLFRRRLRGQLLNRFVATREGIAATPPRRSMGRVGRAVLYASFALAATTTSVLAASQEALPGDLLYPLKREVERFRLQVLPEHLHDDLVAYALGERIDELGALAERGDAARVAALAVIVQRDYAAFVELSMATPTANQHHVTVLGALLERLPEPAQAAIGRVIERESGGRQSGPLGGWLERIPEPAQAGLEEPIGGPSAAGAGSGDDTTGGPTDGSPPQGESAGGGSTHTQPGEPEEPLAPEPTPKPTKEPSAEEGTPKPSRSPRPDPSPGGGGDSDLAPDDGD